MKHASEENLGTIKQSYSDNLYVTQKNFADERKLIYVMSVPNSHYYYHWLKIGDTSEPTYELDNRKNSKDLRKYATKRIKQYMNTAGLQFKVLWAELAYNKNSEEFFRDKEVHEVLRRSGYERGIGCKKYYDPSNEWFKINLDTARKAIKAVKNGHSAIPKQGTNDAKIIFRPEQKQIIKKTDKLFNSNAKSHDSMLWNAKMRFGKTLCALEVSKDMNYHNTLIITHRPEVDQGWFNDFKLLLGNNKQFAYGSKNRGNTLKELKNGNQNYFYFASLQDLVGSKFANGKYDKDSEIFRTKWDLLVIDEAHEGIKTKRAKTVMNNLKYKKSLLLSGTPFNLLSDYNQQQICTWDYTMEQAAKHNWTKVDGHNNTNNPYSTLPKVNMYTFQMGNRYKEFIDPYTRFFNFHQFFKVDRKTGKFFHESAIKQFLRNITTHKPGTDNHYPYSRPEYRKRVSHSLWLLPTRASAGALEKLMNQDPVFKNYGIVNVVKDGDANDGIADTDDVQDVLDSIHHHEHTITLTVRKLTLGVTIKPWTAVVFLSDTSSATQYLQAAFRAQSPYVRKDQFGQPIFKKTNCYIFDFSPERTLTMVSQAVELNPSNNNRLQGKILKKDQISGLKKLLKFMPIVGERGNHMKSYDINTMLRALKRNYAEKAVKNGFDDNSLYNDRLLMRLTSHDLKKFDKLQKFVGSNKQIKKKDKFKLNSQGLNQDEYDNANKGKGKPKKQRTPEEQAAINRLNQAKRQRGKVLPLLRGVSIRIPLMIYGMPGSFDSNISVHDFVNRVDNRSWREFMPRGVTKEFFKGLIKFYDTDIFIEAGKIIRENVKAIDDKDPIKRTQQISRIFSQFKNPDKETVLTPWRVVNMHLGRTLGGLSFYDPKYLEPTNPHWMSNSNRIVFHPSAHILEINSKTGLYPLYMATSLYWQQSQLFKQITGNITSRDERRLWDQILKRNIFIIAKTPMAKDIALRTLIGYSHSNLNIEYEKDLVKRANKDSNQTALDIKRDLNEMKFDVVIGNPPYQKTNGTSEHASPIYPYFVELSNRLSNQYISLIIPARWYTGGSHLDKFREKMLNDIHIKILYDFPNANIIFPKTHIQGGLAIILWNKRYNNKYNGTKVINVVNHNLINCNLRHLNDLNVFIRNNEDYKILSKIKFSKSMSMSQFVSPANPFKFESSFIDSDKAKKDPSNITDPVKIYGHKGSMRYIPLSIIYRHRNWINMYKVFVSKANGIGNMQPDDNVNDFVGEPGSICTKTFLAAGLSLHLTKISANNLRNYLRTKFTRYLISLVKTSQNAYRKVYRFVPLQDFTNDSDIKWDASLDNIDLQLFHKYRLTNEQKAIIQNSIAGLTNGR